MLKLIFSFLQLHLSTNILDLKLVYNEQALLYVGAYSAQMNEMETDFLVFCDFRGDVGKRRKRNADGIQSNDLDRRLIPSDPN